MTNYNEISTDEIYNEIGNDSSIYQTELNGKVISCIGNDGDYFYLLKSIEKFIVKIISTDDLYFTKNVAPSNNSNFISTPTKSKLSSYFKLIPEFILTINELDPYYIYSENIRLFKEVCDELKLYPQSFNEPLDFNYSQNKYEYEIFNDLIKFIRNKSKTVEFSKRVTDRKNYASRITKKLKDYVNALFAKHSRLLVIRLDLSYLVSNDINPIQLVTLEQSKKDLAHLLRNTRHNSLFEHMVGHIWKLEYGKSKGYHYHLILFFLGSQVEKDYYIAKQIGEYWKCFITQNRGSYHNCNDNKEKKKYDAIGKLGIGCINANDANLRFNLLNYVVKYLTKKEQYLQLKLNRKDRVIGKGWIPSEHSGRGRPRNKYVSDQNSSQSVSELDVSVTAPATGSV